MDKSDRMQGGYLGPEYSELDVRRMSRRFGAIANRYESISEVCEVTAGLLAEENVIGWFQGRMEWGPRALGNRSIIGDPRSAEMQRKLNLKIKYREGFRPFAPAVQMECLQEYFDLDVSSPYMLLVADLQESRRKPLPADYQERSVRDKLYQLRSDIPSVTHVDFSARIQTVHRETNPNFWQLLDAFRARTGYGVLVNTSFNIRGEPIVMTPEDAYRCFMRTEMDYLVIGNFVFAKSEQPPWQEPEAWREEYQPD
jgi:Predicted carbamoyl transferase, NodU family